MASDWLTDQGDGFVVALGLVQHAPEVLQAEGVQLAFGVADGHFEGVECAEGGEGASQDLVQDLFGQSLGEGVQQQQLGVVPDDDGCGTAGVEGPDDRRQEVVGEERHVLVLGMAFGLAFQDAEGTFAEVVGRQGDVLGDELAELFGVEGDLVEAGGTRGDEEVGGVETVVDELVVGFPEGFGRADEVGFVAVHLRHEEVGGQLAEKLW